MISVNAKDTIAPHADLQISDSSGTKNMVVDLTKELAVDGVRSISIKVEVTDETQRTYETMATVKVESQPFKMEFDAARTHMVYRTGMDFQAVVCWMDYLLQPCNE